MSWRKRWWGSSPREVNQAHDEEGQQRPEESQRLSRLRILMIEGPPSRLTKLGVIVALALVVLLAIQAWVAKPYTIPSGSMEPTLDVGSRILVNRLAGDPNVGDIVVFNPPASDTCGITVKGEEPWLRGEPCPQAIDTKSTETFVKRVVAGPGDTLSVRDGHPVLNGVEKTDEPYINPCVGGGACDLPKTITIPPDHYFMMGDNRGQSEDSRFWGPVPRDWILGKAFAIMWPPDSWGGL